MCSLDMLSNTIQTGSNKILQYVTETYKGVLFYLDPSHGGSFVE